MMPLRGLKASVLAAMAAVLATVSAAAATSAWTPQISGTNNPLKGVYFTDSCHGWLVGENAGGFNNSPSDTPPAISSTTDGGRTWTPRSAGVKNVTLNRVFFIDNSFGWAVGEPIETIRPGTPPGTNHNGKGTVFYTTDGGVTWNHNAAGVPGVATTAEQDFEDVSFRDRVNGWIGANSDSGAGAKPGIYNSKDGGHTWVKQAVPLGVATQDIPSVYFLPGTTKEGWAVTQNGHVLHTTNDGDVGLGTWADRATLPNFTAPTDNSRDPETVRFFDSKHGLVVGDEGGAWWTVDGGITWTLSTTTFPPFRTLEDVSFTDVLHASIAADETNDNGAVYTTADGGKTWTSHTVGTNLKGISVVRGTTNTWTVGIGGDVFANNANACPPAASAAPAATSTPKLPNAGAYRGGNGGGGIPVWVWVALGAILPGGAVLVARRV